MLVGSLLPVTVDRLNNDTCAFVALCSLVLRRSMSVASLYARGGCVAGSASPLWCLHAADKANSRRGRVCETGG